MKYEKPEVVVLGSAVDTVQSNGKNGIPGDGGLVNTAYEADE